MRILVTGSSGMIGTALTPVLVRAGHKVVCLDIRRPQESFRGTFIQHDLRKSLPIKKFGRNKRIDLIVHLAANARVYELVLNPARALDNIAMTHTIFEFARVNGIPRLLFASSREAYGNRTTLPVREEAASQRSAESSYTASKISGEAYCYAYSNCYNLDAKIARFSNVYGKYDFSDRFIPKVIRLMKKNKPVTIYGRKKLLDFTYIDDTVRGILALVDAWDGAAKNHREFNISSGKGVALITVARLMREYMGSRSDITIGETLIGEVMSFAADTSRMRRIGWRPHVSLTDGLQRAIAYYR